MYLFPELEGHLANAPASSAASFQEYALTFGGTGIDQPPAAYVLPPKACQQLGLDTREVCNRGYHKSVQIFLSRIDPRLRFERNYETLRPHSPYCEEILRIQ